MTTKITDNQNKAINSTSKLTLVSSSAGTGKTFVLVERVIRNILNGISLKNMLIVTFTNAAAKEIRERIKKRLIQESNKNSVFLKEYMTIDESLICTIDDFCINIMRKYISGTNFRILSEYETLELNKNSIYSSIEDVYKKNDKNLINMIEFFDSSNNQEKFIEILESWIYFSKNLYSSNDFINKSIENFKSNSENSKFVCFIKEYILKKIKHVLEIMKLILEDTSKDEELKEKYYPSIIIDFKKMEEILNSEKLNAVIQKIKLFEFTKLKPAKKSYKKEYIKTKLQICKNEISKLQKVSSHQETELSKKILESFFKIAKDVNDKIQKAKEERNIFEFFDIEKKVLSFLKIKENLEIFKDLEEVIVDEYQDVNNIQDEIFNLIGKSKFLVGDYKQSIYKFRGALPEIFESKKKEESCLTINLDVNFRSRKQILNFVNDCFCNLMSNQTNLIEYEGNEELKYGANYVDKNEQYIRFFAVDVDENRTFEESECDFIAKKIKSLIENKIQVFDSENFRNAKLSDFCVLFRNFSKYSNYIFKSFNKYGIKFKTNDLSDFINCYETNFIISILKIIDNPTLDIPFTFIVLSDFFGFTYGDLSNIKNLTLCTNLYYDFKECSLLNFNFSEKCKFVVNYIENLRKEYMRNSLMSVCIKIIYDMKKRTEVNEFNTQKFIYILNEFYHSEQIINIKNFVNYINYGNISSIENFDNRDAVLITSIHKSKGKEFPICFLGGTSSNFVNEDDIIMFDLNLGTAFNTHESDGNMFKDSMNIYSKYQSRSEELRVLYVGLTRAKEYIFITSAVKKQKRKETIEIFDEKKHIHPVIFENAKNFSEWIKLIKKW